MQVNLFVPGAAKSGTSSLHKYLDLHPDVQMSKFKEPHIYSRHNQYLKRAEIYSQSCFDNTTVRYRGESSTTYMVSEEVPARIKLDCEEARFIFVLRHPVDRIISHFNWLCSLGQVQNSFKQEIAEWIDQPFCASNDLKGNYKHYVEFSRYGRHVGRYIDSFGRDHVHLIRFEDLVEDPVQAVGTCFDFLGLEPLLSVERIHANRTRTTPSPTKNYRSLLAQLHPRHWRRARPLGQVSRKTMGRGTNRWLIGLLQDDLRRFAAIAGSEFPIWPEFR